MGRLLETFFGERSFHPGLKLAVFILALLFFATIAAVYFFGLLARQEARLLTYFFFIVIFAVTYYCGFKPGIVLTIASSFLVVFFFIPAGTTFTNLTPGELELFPFLALYFLTAIATDWLRENYENVERQMARNKELYEQAKNIEKLALAGEIAAGIAHEIRNPLTVVQGYLQILRRNAQDREIFDILIEEIKRTNQIVSDFLKFSRPSRPDLAAVCLNNLAETAVTLIAGEAARSNVTVVLHKDPGVPLLEVDREQLIQALLNLCVNGIQAMPRGGTLTIATGLSPDGSKVEVTVSDTGDGIPRELMPKIFAPFFTTREHGTGLGLSISQAVVNAHGGHISVESKPGQGSRFTLCFPAGNQLPGKQKKEA